MDGRLLILLLGLTLAAAMPAQTSSGKPICASRTPCAWTVYDPITKRIISDLVQNTYCDCAGNTSCVRNELDDLGRNYVYRCRDPSEELDDES